MTAAGNTNLASLSRFQEIIAANRAKLSMSFQAATGAIKEIKRATGAMVQAEARCAAAANLTEQDRLAAEINRQYWIDYISMHGAVAEQGAILMLNAIDLALKEYSRLQHGSDKRWLQAGPVYTATGSPVSGSPKPKSAVTLLELVRALCNYFRHREEWIANGTQSNRSIRAMTNAGLSPLSPTAWVNAVELLAYPAWLDLEADLMQAIASLP